MKKTRILFILCLVAALTIGMAVTASAAAPTNGIQYVNAICIEMDAPWDGDEIPRGALTSADYTITACSLAGGVHTPLEEAIAANELKWRHEGYFSGGNHYYLDLTVILLDAFDVNYNFSETVSIYLNGEKMGEIAPTSETNVKFSNMYLEARHRNNTFTTLPALPVAEAGAAIAPYSYAEPNGAYTVTGTWNVYDHATGTVSAATGNFESGKLYQLVLNSVAGEAYYFHDQELWVESEDRWYHQDESVSTSSNTTYRIAMPCGEMNVISNLYITGVPAQITAGQTAGAVTLAIDPNATPEGCDANFTAKWLDAEGNVFTGIFEEGGVYYLSVTVTPKAGNYLERNLLVADKTSEQSDYTQTDGLSATVEFRYSLKPKVNQIDITGVVGAVIGQTATTEGIKVPNGAEYSIKTEALCWYAWYTEDVTTFASGDKYFLYIPVVLAEGYELDEDLAITINGVTLEENYYSYGENEAYIHLEYSFLQVVNKIDITGVTGAVIGQTPTLEGIQASTGAEVKLEYNTGWQDTTNGYWADVEGTFQDHHKYVLQLYLESAKGYEFAEDMEITINGQNINDVDNWYGYGGSESYYLNLEYSFVDVVKTLEITGVTDAAVGQTATTEGITCEAADLVATWYDEDGEVFTGTFETGKKYYLVVKHTLKEGYEIQGNLRVYINGERAEVWYGDEGTYAFVAYSFKTVTAKVDITGATAAVIGQTATVEGIQVSGAKHGESGWVDYDAQEFFSGTFADGGKYYLIVTFEANEGCEFGEDTVVTLNGVEVDEDSVSFFSDTEGQIFIEYNFKKKIDKVEFTGMPQFAVGSAASVSGLKVPEGANYTVDAVWIDDEGEFTGTFTDDESYSLYIMIEPKAGYEFSDDVQVLIDGKAADTNYKYMYDSQIELGYFYKASSIVLDKIEITVTEPTIGAQISDKLISVSKDANYSAGGYWLVSEDGKKWEEADGVFEEGKYYAIDVWFEIDDGHYMLANNGQIVINGTAVVVNEENGYIRPEYGYFMMKYDALCAHTYGAWTSVDGKTHSQTCSKCGNVATEEHEWHSEKDEKCPVCGYVRSDNPPTGDAIVPAALLALCSLTVLVVINKRRSAR